MGVVWGLQIDLIRIPMEPVLVLCYCNEILTQASSKVEKVLAFGSQFCRVGLVLGPLVKAAKHRRNVR